MKLYSLSILRVTDIPAQDPIIVCASVDVSDFGFFQRGGVREFITFVNRTVAKRVPAMSRVQVTEKENAVYCQSFAGGRLAICATTDLEYNSRVAFTMIQQVAERFMQQFQGRWETVDRDNAIEWPDLEQTLRRYQNPQEADAILRIQRDIDETKTIMVSAIDQVLERGEKLDDLIVRSADLSDSSKQFYSQSKSMNSWCCVVA